MSSAYIEEFFSYSFDLKYSAVIIPRVHKNSLLHFLKFLAFAERVVVEEFLSVSCPFSGSMIFFRSKSSLKLRKSSSAYTSIRCQNPIFRPPISSPCFYQASSYFLMRTISFVFFFSFYWLMLIKSFWDSILISKWDRSLRCAPLIRALWFLIFLSFLEINWSTLFFL